MSLINNTITRNDGRGIFLGPRTTAGTTTASTDAFLRNNIVQDNGTINLQVAIEDPTSRDGYDATHDLIFPATYSPRDLGDASDLNVDAMFFKPNVADFRLLQPRNGPSPAVDAGVEENAASGPQADFGALRERTTAPNGGTDTGTLDLGFHYPP